MRAPAAALIAAALLGSAVIMDHRYVAATPDPARTQGVVVGFSRMHGKITYPIFDFLDAAGQRHRVTNSRRQNIVRFHLGDTVPVAYSRSQPDQARIDAFWITRAPEVVALIVAPLIVLWGFKRGR